MTLTLVKDSDPVVLPMSGEAGPSNFGARVTGLNLCDPIRPDHLAMLKAALDRYAFLVLPDQPMTSEAQLAVTAHWGAVQRSYAAAEGVKRRITETHLSDVANLDENDRFLQEGDPRRIFSYTNKVWHSDTTYKPIPTKVAFLSAHEIPPEGGNTEWCDMRAAYDRLDPAMQARIADLRVVHSQAFSRAQLGLPYSEDGQAKNPPADHPLVRIQPGTGRRYLYLSSHASHILGWPEEEGRALIAELTATATDRTNIYAHRWAVGDFLIWDNATTMHRACPWDEFRYRRVLRRSGVDEDQRP